MILGIFKLMLEVVSSMENPEVGKYKYRKNTSEQNIIHILVLFIIFQQAERGMGGLYYPI